MAELSEGLRRDAELVVGVCMSVESGDVVTVITDNDHLSEADGGWTTPPAVATLTFPVGVQ